MRRALALLLVLLAAAVPAALARPAHHHRCNHHRRRCHRPHRSTPQPAPAQQHPVAPAPTPTGSGTAGTGASGPAPAGQTPGGQTPTRIGVVTREYSLTLSRSTITQGSALVQLQNFGEDPHNLRIERVDGSGTATDFAQAGAGGLETRTVALRPGVYKLYCTLPGHDALGMHATLTVGG